MTPLPAFLTEMTMELTYQVPRDTYVNLLESMIRKNDRRPLKMLTALLLTVGQMAAVILLCIFKLEGSQRIFVLIWSVLVAGITVLRRCTARQRAKGTLTRLEYSGQLPEDYWKKHRLTVAERELRRGAAKLSAERGGAGGAAGRRAVSLLRRHDFRHRTQIRLQERGGYGSLCRVPAGKGGPRGGPHGLWQSAKAHGRVCVAHGGT